jgi:F-type H+-transporting ATPase subunit epsilon
MVGLTSSVFQISFFTPQGRLFEGKAGSLIIPGYDGQWGVLRNHCPMLCVLGFGLVRIEQVVDRPNAYFIVNGGFLRVNENTATVLAYDVTTFEKMEPAKAKDLLAQARSIIHGGEYISSQTDEVMDFRKAALIVRMGQYARIDA